MPPITHRSSGSFNANSIYNMSVKDFVAETSDPQHYSQVYDRMFTEENFSKFSTKNENWIEDSIKMIDANSNSKIKQIDRDLKSINQLCQNINVPIHNNQIGGIEFAKKGKITVMKNKMLKELNLVSGEYTNFRVISKDM